MDQNILLSQKDIETLIYTIHGKQVMLDSDLAKIYRVQTKVFNQAVKRNIERFPDTFRFQLTQDEFDVVEKRNKGLRSQNVTSSPGHGGRRYLPFVFSEPGIAMLSAVLKSDVAVTVSIAIMNAFVEMRSAILGHAALFYRLDTLELKQTQSDHKFETLFRALENGKLHNDKGIFYDGQVFDAYTFVADIIRSAKSSIILIDNYIDDTVLTLLGKRNNAVAATIYTGKISAQLQLDIQRYNSQYSAITFRLLANAHDRFLIVDGTRLYHIGASLKDIGKKWFAFSRMDLEAAKMLAILDSI